LLLSAMRAGDIITIIIVIIIIIIIIIIDIFKVA